MAFSYRAKKRRNGINDKENYYATPARPGKVITSLIAKQISDRSSLTKADVYAALISLGEVIQLYFQMGYTVKMDGLGTLSVSITSDGYATEEEVMPHPVMPKRVWFIADKQLKNEIY